MDSRLLDFLRCPVSGARLALHVIASESRGSRTLVKVGVLTCEESMLWYPIINFVPVMLSFATPLSRKFAVEHAGLLGALGGYRMPSETPLPGERSVQRTFTEEWEGLGADEVTFVYTDDDLRALHRDVWLQLPPEGSPATRTVLNVGCGFGREAAILTQIFPNADVFAVDLNLSVLQSAPGLNANHRLHVIVASLFRLPFVPSTIDHVHSQGVIHHTHSTEAAFRSISAMVNDRGSLFVWVYAFDDALIGRGVHRALVILYYLVSHGLGRPLLSRLPGGVRNLAALVLTALLHPVMRARSRHRARWRFKNSMHSVRDAWSPRYARLHRFNDVLEWFQREGYRTTPQSVARYRELTGKPMMGIGILGIHDAP